MRNVYEVINHTTDYRAGLFSSVAKAVNKVMSMAPVVQAIAATQTTEVHVKNELTCTLSRWMVAQYAGVSIHQREVH